MSFFTALCAGIACGCLLYWILQVMSRSQLEKAEAEDASTLPLLIRMALPFLSGFRKIAQMAGIRSFAERIAPRLWMGGFGDRFSGEDFLCLRLFFLVLGGLFLLLGAVSGRILLCGFIGIMLMLYPGLWLSAVIKKRQLSIMKALPNVLDLLTLSVESGRDLISSLRDILARRRPDPLGEELSRAFREIQLGRPRSEALRAMAQRVRQNDLTATVNAIVQSEELGVSIANSLRIQGDMQRAKRFSLAEKLANESSVKIILPVVVFILPAVFIILLGPIIMQASRLFR